MNDAYYVKRNPELIDRKVIEDIKADIKALHLIGYADMNGKVELAERAVLECIDRHLGSEVQE